MGVEGCLACDLADGRVELPGGRIHESDYWLVEHCFGPLGVGTLIVKPKRHLVHVADLSEDEAVELGPLLQRTASIVTLLSSPDQVYVCLWSHKGGTPVHIHFVVQPVTSEQRNALGGGARLQASMFEADEMPPTDAVQAFAERARLAFASS